MVMERLPLETVIPARLTEGELRVAMLAATGKTNKQVAEELVISDSTVRAHMRAAFIRTGCTNRTQLTLWLIRAGLVVLEEAKGTQS